MRFSFGDCGSKPKVYKLDNSIVSDHNVVGLYIAMRDSMCMEIADGFGDFQGNVVLMD